jgi:hypothetical protein
MLFRANRGITDDVEAWEVVENVRQVLSCAEDHDPRFINFDLSPFVQLTHTGTIVSTTKGTLFRDVVAAYNESIPKGSKFGKLAGIWYPLHTEWRFEKKDFFLVNLIAVKCFKEKETITFPEKTIETVQKLSRETQKNEGEGASEIEEEVESKKKEVQKYKEMLKRRSEMLKRYRE